jgi:hypothetical protein
MADTQQPPGSPPKPPAGSGPGVTLTRDAAERTRRAVRFVEDTLLSPGSARRPHEPRGAIIPARWARLTATSIGPRSGANCYSGAITFQDVSASGVLSDTSETGTGWNGTTKTMAGGSGRYYQAVWANGLWWLWPSDCNDLS